MRRLVFLLCLTFAAVPSFAGSLDAPGIKPITVRSEIERGKAAVLDLAVKFPDISDFSDAVEKLESKNTQDRTDTPGFFLGLAFQEWRTLWSSLSYGVYKGSALNLALVEADISYQGYQNLRKKLDLTADQMKECESEYNGQAEDQGWENAFASKEFRGTYLHTHKRAAR